MRTMKTKSIPKARVEVATHPLEVIVTVGDRQLGAQITPTTARRMAKALLELAETEQAGVGKKARGIAFTSEDLGALLKHLLSECAPARQAAVDSGAPAQRAALRKLREDLRTLRAGIRRNGEALDRQQKELGKLLAASGGTRH